MKYVFILCIYLVFVMYAKYGLYFIERHRGIYLMMVV